LKTIECGNCIGYRGVGRLGQQATAATGDEQHSTHEQVSRSHRWPPLFLRSAIATTFGAERARRRASSSLASCATSGHC
jgi:hypothetical protein